MDREGSEAAGSRVRVWIHASPTNDRRRQGFEVVHREKNLWTSFSDFITVSQVGISDHGFFIHRNPNPNYFLEFSDPIFPNYSVTTRSWIWRRHSRVSSSQQHRAESDRSHHAPNQSPRGHSWSHSDQGATGDETSLRLNRRDALQNITVRVVLRASRGCGVFSDRSVLLVSSCSPIYDHRSASSFCARPDHATTSSTA